MKTPRSTAIAERLIVWLCLLSFVGWVSYELGRYVELKQCPRPVLKKQEFKKLNINTMSKQGRRAWVRYWEAQS